MAKLSALTNTNKINLNTAGTTVLSKRKPISSIGFHPEFQNLFPINPTTLQQIKESMKEHGYDESQPLLIWKEEGVLLDGHTRLAAAKENNFFDIPVYEKSFTSLEEALEYALSLQVARRNLTDAELVKAVLALDKLKKRGVKAEDEENIEELTSGKSSELLAKKLNTSGRKIEKIRSVNKNTPELMDKIINNELSIESGYQESRKKIKAIKEKKENRILEEAGFLKKPKATNGTLYQVIKEKSVEELAAYLVLVQQQPALTKTQWIDELNQMSFFDNPLKPEWAKTPTATKDTEQVEEDVEIDVEDLL